METKRLCITCPVCGKTVGKATLVNHFETKCPTCKSELQAEITSEHKVIVQVLREGKTSVGA